MHQARRNNMADVSAKDSSQVSIEHWGDSMGEGRGQDRPQFGSVERGPECTPHPHPPPPAREVGREPKCPAVTQAVGQS